MEELALIDIWKDEQSVYVWAKREGKRKVGDTPVQTLVSRPEMVYPGSQVQWVVPWVMVQRDGRTWEPAVAAGSVDAAAASDMFVIVMKTGEKKGAGRGHVSIQYMFPYSCGPPAEGLRTPALVSVFDCEFAAYMLAGGSGRWAQTSLCHTRRRTGWLHPRTSLRSGTGRKHTRWCLIEKRKAEWLRSTSVCDLQLQSWKERQLSCHLRRRGAHNGDEVIHRALWATRRQNDL